MTPTPPPFCQGGPLPPLENWRPPLKTCAQLLTWGGCQPQVRGKPSCFQFEAEIPPTGWNQGGFLGVRLLPDPRTALPGDLWILPTSVCPC